MLQKRSITDNLLRVCSTEKNTRSQNRKTKAAAILMHSDTITFNVPGGHIRWRFSMRVSVSIDEDVYKRCQELHDKRGDSTMSKTMSHLIEQGLKRESRSVRERQSKDEMDALVEELRKTIRRENDAILDKALSKFDKAVGKVSSIQKQAINAAGASNGSLIAAITLMSCYLEDHPDSHGEWVPLDFADRWRFFFGTGRQLAFEKDALRDFFHAFKDAPERCGNECANLADLYLEQDDEWAERLMCLPDTVGLDYLARRSAKEMSDRG